ncbi:recombinase [Brevundimonas diminuta 3F5N]|uniref:Recombinase n=1 Tax=Brevundimonas diminuta 3F5N TaxID=1255603 RepID=A0A1R4FHF8_BREDI|nr:recombinase family protein [Brevundimonas diminuta]SJM55251.1 recombinase [Brevundimonas diminuta 3F5N]
MANAAPSTANRPLMRAALYARFSSDLQKQTSIEDQFVACRAFAARQGIEIVGAFEDAGISGASIANRPGFLAMERAAKGGAFNVVICEALDRLSRSQADIAAIYEDLRFNGVAIHTISEGAVDELHVGLKGTMNALFLQEIRRKTRRGLEGVVRDGRHTGGRVYGYAIRREFDAAGEPIRGLRDIVPAEAEVVVEIFRKYAAGASPRAIAADMNARGIPSPRGKAWNASTINGNAERGNGVIHNELYRGFLVFGRQTWLKDRSTGARSARKGDPAAIVRQAVPDLRIVPEELWLRARTRYEENRLGPQKTSPLASVRPKHLLSGKLTCGCCGGPMIRSGSEQRFVCSWRRERGPTACDNGRGVKGADIADRVLAALRDRLLAPDIVASAMEEARLEMEKRNREVRSRRGKQEADLAEAIRRSERLIDQVADGVLSGAAIKDKLAALEAQRTALEAELAAEEAPSPVSLHPGIAEHYRRVVGDLAQALHRSDSEAAAEARDLVRRLIETVVVTPLPERGQYGLTVKGQIAALVGQDGDCTIVVGAGVGFEPTTFRL